MKTVRRDVFWYGFVAGFSALFFSACQPAREASTPPPEPPRNGASVSLPDARYEIVKPTLEQQDEQGRTLWKLEAQSLQAETQSEKAQGVLVQVKGWLYREGKPVLEFRAPYARANADTREVEAWGNVVAASKTNDARLEAGRILWKSRADRIIASERVFLKWGALELRERALHVDTALEKVWGTP
ncbi:MAG: LPS export ABC transporter periplasmic protein LptC [Fimbriimonadales bacterium]|nr:LPS export ABC transporter periplasmic protein LptC [Fimbriimonadales bacterium]